METLAVKYRPTEFEDVVEQKGVIAILKNQIQTNTTKNAYLFTGGAGTGKTTVARIFADKINGGKGNPIEIDAASNNGVENVRDIIDNAKFKALDAPYKVYIIDECHMLSTGAWNAMLKLLEEPPAQTIFIMCTTDPQKIPPTILSRVQRYDFQRITHPSVVNRLRYILEAENQTAEVQGSLRYDDESLEYIAKIADGGMRDAITLLDKCISFSPELSMKNVIEALGAVDYEIMFNLTLQIINQESGEAVTTVEEIHRKGADLKQFIKQYSYFLIDVCKYSILQSFDYLQIPSIYRQNLDDLVALAEYDFLLYLMKEILKLSATIKWETSPKPLIEGTVLMLCIEE